MVLQRLKFYLQPKKKRKLLNSYSKRKWMNWKRRLSLL
jgi:hypothetical protein